MEKYGMKVMEFQFSDAVKADSELKNLYIRCQDSTTGKFILTSKKEYADGTDDIESVKNAVLLLEKDYGIKLKAVALEEEK
jgi:hypothetical protein